jgi:hypothetical protein
MSCKYALFRDAQEQSAGLFGQDWLIEQNAPFLSNKGAVMGPTAISEREKK